MSAAALVFLLVALVAALFGFSDSLGGQVVEAQAAFYAALIGFVFFTALGPARLSGRKSRLVLMVLAGLIVAAAVVAARLGFAGSGDDETAKAARSVFWREGEPWRRPTGQPGPSRRPRPSPRSAAGWRCSSTGRRPPRPRCLRPWPPVPTSTA